MSAPTLQAEGTTAAVTSGNLTITLPTYAADDIVIINTVGYVPNTTTGANTQSLASPWTKYSPDVTRITSSLIDAEYAIWWARATSNSSLGTTVTITRPTSWDTGTDTCWGGRAYVIRGCKTTGDPFDAWTASSILTAANGAFPGVSYTAGNNLVVQFLCVSDNTSVGTAPSGWTAGTEDNDATGTDCTFQTFRQTFSTSGTATSTASTSSVAAPLNTNSGYVFFGVSFTDVPIARTASDTGTGSESATGARVAKTITRTASDTGTGTESATGVFFSVFQRTASDTGTGTEFADGTHLHTRTASDTGTGTESAVGAFFSVEARTASDTGTGTESATFNIVPGTIVHQVTASDTGTGTESASGSRVVGRTASDTGAGTETVSRLVVRFRTVSDTGTGSATATPNVVAPVQRTASASGTGTESATPNIVAPVRRTATAAGTGTEAATPVVVRPRAASGTGVGTQTTVSVLTALRTASSTGSGASSVTSARALFRTADASGAGTQAAVGSKLFTRTATATGTGTETPATWVKSFIFRPPVNDQFAFVDRLDDSEDANLLSRLVRGGRAKNVFRLTDGSYTNIDPLDPALVDKIYLGGHNNMVSAEEKADLIAAGYTVT